MYSKVTKGTSKPTETTTGYRNENNTISLLQHYFTISLFLADSAGQEGRRSLSLTLGIHDSVQQNSNRPGRHSLYP